jgi:hypothetical protein
MTFMTLTLSLNRLLYLIFSVLIFTTGFQSVRSINGSHLNTSSITPGIPIENISEFNVKISAPASGVYHGANPGFGGTEDEVSKERVIDYEKVSGKKIAWAYFSNNWINNITFPEKTVRTLDSLDIVPFIRMMPRTDFNQGESDPVFNLQGIIDGIFDDSLIQWATDAKKPIFP